MTYKVQVVEVEARPLAAIRERAELNELGTKLMPLFDAVWAYIRAHDVKPFGHNVVIYKDRALAEVGVEASGTLPPDERVVASSTPAGRTATTVHWGDYSGLPAAFEAIRSWCQAKGHQLGDTGWEVYGDWSDDPATRRTDVFFLLA